MFRPSVDRPIAERQFSALCLLAYELGHVALVVDELSTVTRSSSAPPGWWKATHEGRHRHLRIYCAAQRPTEVDNGLFSLATVIRTGRLNAKGDREKLADVLDVPATDIAELGAHGFIERDMLTGRVTRG